LEKGDKRKLNEGIDYTAL
jgi:hypothetical protein